MYVELETKPYIIAQNLLMLYSIEDVGDKVVWGLGMDNNLHDSISGENRHFLSSMR